MRHRLQPFAVALDFHEDGIPASNTAVFNVLQDHGIAQATPDGKAIWKATVTSDAGWSHSFTFLKLAPSLIWESGERPAPFAGSVRLEQDAACDAESARHDEEVVADKAIAAPVPAAPPHATPDTPSMDGVDPLPGLPRTALGQISSAAEAPPRLAPATSAGAVSALESIVASTDTKKTADEGPVSGEHFMAWLKRGIQSRRLIINDAKALVHTVADTVYLVSPGLFQRYAQEHPQAALLAKQDKVADWQWVQKRFEKLRIHRKQDSGLNIWTCEVTGPRKSRRLHGYLLADPSSLFSERPANNPYLRLAEGNASAP